MSKYKIVIRQKKDGPILAENEVEIMFGGSRSAEDRVRLDMKCPAKIGQYVDYYNEIDGEMCHLYTAEVISVEAGHH